MDTKQFLKQIAFITLFLLLVLFLTLTWLKYYTNHGQKLELPDYEQIPLSEAQDDANDRSFQIIVNDSVHIVGQDGGIVIDQNPKAGSMVKENRKIYVTITKYNPDKWSFADLPQLYGSDFEQKRRELSYMEIESSIKGYKFDKGEPNHILEVWHKDEIIVDGNIERKNVEIEKGGTLQFVLSKSSGGTTAIPNLLCLTLGEARFYLPSIMLKLGEVNGGNDDNYYIVSQSPAYLPGDVIDRGSPINVTVQTTKPESCN